MHARIHFTWMLLALCPAAFAAAPPGAGGQLQQIPPSPTPDKVVPRVDLPQRNAPPADAPDSAKITVTRLRITGTQAYSEARLLEVTGFQPGAELSLTDLRGMAARLADFYHRNGYFVAQAYLPAQDIKDGVVTIAVIDGVYGQVRLDNQAGVTDRLAYGLLGGIDAGDSIVLAPLESRLLLLSDLPGVRVNSTLVPGAEAGSSDLIVTLTPGRRVSGSIDADNAGNRYTGANRIGATVNFNEPIGQGDVASLRTLTSGAGLRYLRASYQMQFGRATAGVAYSALNYKLGEEFESLQAHGSARVASLYGSYPLIRSRNSNLYAGLVLDNKSFQDSVDSISAVSDKRARVLTASLYGDAHDGLGQGGRTSYSIALAAGRLDLQTPAVRSLDALTAQTHGAFNKLGFQLARQQTVTDSLSLFAAVSGQLASKNLDVSERMELGGMYGVRAYPEGEAYADEGYLVTLEARVQLPRLSQQTSSQLQLVGFVDAGTVTINKTPWTAGPNRRTLSGAGVGFIWSDRNNFIVRAYYAVKVGSETATSAPDKSGRFWIQAVAYF